MMQEQSNKPLQQKAEVLPAGTASQVLLGQRTIAGETILGRIGDAAERRGAAQ